MGGGGMIVETVETLLIASNAAQARRGAPVKDIAMTLVAWGMIPRSGYRLWKSSSSEQELRAK
jgi:hypothetical protein